MTTYQENFAKAFDVNEIQESFKKLFDAEKFQDNLKDFYNVESYQENLEKLFSNEAFGDIKKYTESLVDQEQVEKSVKLGANVIAANTNAVTDAITLKAIQTRQGVEAALKQVHVLASAKDVKEAAEAQQAYVKSLQNELTETAWLNIGLVAGVVETNFNLAKEALDQVKSAQVAA